MSKNAITCRLFLIPEYFTRTVKRRCSDKNSVADCSYLQVCLFQTAFALVLTWRTKSRIQKKRILKKDRVNGAKTMTKFKPLFLVAVVVASITMLAGETWAQCSSCNQAPAFGYPARGGCGGGGCGGGGGGLAAFKGDLKARHAQTKAINSRIAARNEAWPKPFACNTRQLYHQIWTPMVEKGYQEQCTLGQVHFNPETNQLNKFGVTQVAAIMRNMPLEHKKVFLHKVNVERVNDKRMSSVRDTINTYYSFAGPARVAFTDQPPVVIRGDAAGGIITKAIEGAPSPIIPVGSGGSVSDAVTQ